MSYRAESRTFLLRGGVTVWNRYNKKLGGGDWNPDSGTSHAVHDGRTFCGRRVGTVENGWELNTYASGPNDADCRACNAVVAKAASDGRR